MSTLSVQGSPQPSLRRRRRRRGMGPLVSVAIAAVIIGLFSVQGYQSYLRSQQEAMDYAVGDYLSTAADVAAAYVQSQFPALAFPMKSEVNPRLVTWATVSAAIPNAGASPNAFSQTVSLVIRAMKGYDQDGNGIACQNDAGELCPIEGFVVLTGGAALNDSRLGRTARRVSEGRGGGIFSALRMPAVTAPVISNAAGGATWTVLNTDIAAAIAWPGTGHPMARFVVGGGLASTLALSRYPHPVANTMHASIDMGTNNITNMTDACLSAGYKSGACLSNAIQQATIAAAGDIITKPTCPAPFSPNIWGIPVAASDNGVGASIIGWDAWATDNGATWTVNLTVTTPNSTGDGTVTVTPTSSWGKLAVFMNCQ